MARPSESSSAFQLIRRGPFARLWWAGLVSSTGDWVTIFATLAVADRIAGGTGTLIAIVSRVIPGLLIGAVVGVIADRVDRRKLLLFSDVGRAALVPLLALATDLPTLVAINIFLEFLSLLGQSPRTAVLPRLVPQHDLVTANSLTLGAAYGTIPIGAAFNWFLDSLPAVTFWGIVPEQNAEFGLAFFADSFTFLASFGLMWSLPAMARTLSADRTAGRRLAASLRDLRDGATFLWKEGTVRRVIVAMTTALSGGGVIIVLGIRFVEDVLRADTRGFFAVVTTLGIGAGLGIVSVSLYANRLFRRDVVFGLAIFVTGVGLAAAGTTNTVPGAAAWMFVMGVGAGSGYVIGLTSLHEEVDDELRGRVFAALFSLMRIGLFVSMAVAVPLQGVYRRSGLDLLASAPTRAVLVTGGMVIVASAALTLWSVRAVFSRPKLGPTERGVLEEASRARSTVDDDGDHHDGPMPRGRR